MAWLSGKKTYICAVALAVATFAHSMGWISDAQFTTVSGLIVSLGGMALRAAIGK